MSTKLIGVRPIWNKTFSYWEIEKFIYFASETCALDIVGATYVRDVENGEIVVLKIKIKSVKPFPRRA